MGTTTQLLFKKGNRVSSSSLSFLLKLTLMRIDLLALEVTELPPNQATSSHKGALLQAAPPASAARSQRTEASAAAGKPAELTDIPDPGGREGYKTQSWPGVA